MQWEYLHFPVIKDPEYWSGPRNRTRDLRDLCSQHALPTELTLILSYENSNINAVNPLQDNGGQNNTDFCIKFIAACTVKEIIILFFRLETEKAAMQTELEDTKSQLESFKRY